MLALLRLDEMVTYPALLILQEELAVHSRNESPSISRTVVCGFAYAKHEIPDIATTLVYAVYLTVQW